MLHKDVINTKEQVEHVTVFGLPNEKPDGIGPDNRTATCLATDRLNPSLAHYSLG